MPRRLLVIDGADRGQSFLLPETGTILIGNSRRHADVCLHDLYVSRIHCEVAIEGEQVTVKDNNTPAGILVNGTRVPQQALQLGDVVRIGNSYLRLEEAQLPASGRPAAVRPTPARAVNNAAAAPAAAPGPAAQDKPAGPRKLPNVPADRLAELTCHTLAHFQLGHVLGRGYSGVVFRAHDLKTKQTVALKVLAPEFPANAGEMNRLVKVLRPTLAVRHPNLVAVLGAGMTGPYFWMALELVEGESLAGVIERLRTVRKIKWRRALRVGIHMALALEALRGHRLVHGNITPKNILVPVADDDPIMLNDVALFKGLEGSVLQGKKLEEKLLAELPYLSPEHSDPEAILDDLSDQYGLGAVLYALLTGRPPFEGASPEEVLEQVRETPPVRPQQYQPAIPDELQAVVMRMLAKRPEERYLGPGPLLADLERIAAEYSEEL
jgi:serine/threonine-protein kinase